MPTVRENTLQQDSNKSYPEPTQVPLAEKAKVYRCNPIKGIQQISPVS